MIEATQLAPGPIYRATKPWRSRPYRQFVKRHACAGCGTMRDVDPAHTGPHPYSVKASDATCIPLCRYQCHRKFDADPKGFAAARRLNVAAQIKRLNAAWKIKQGAMK